MYIHGSHSFTTFILCFDWLQLWVILTVIRNFWPQFVSPGPKQKWVVNLMTCQKVTFGLQQMVHTIGHITDGTYIWLCNRCCPQSVAQKKLQNSTRKFLTISHPKMFFRHFHIFRCISLNSEEIKKGSSSQKFLQ